MAALAAVVAGVVAIAVALTSQQSAPEPPASGEGRISVAATSPHHRRRTVAPATQAASGAAGTSGVRHSAVRRTPERPSPEPTGLALAPSRPTRIDIPSIDVHSAVIGVGKNPDGTLAVPQPGPNLDKVAWYRGSPTPGQSGPSVLEGHVDTTEGPSVFFRLGALRPGNLVRVTRTDGGTTVFTVNAVRSYASHAQFPRATVFGSDIATPTLRLITCSNFDESTGHYEGNTVVFAHLTAVRRATS